MAKPQLTIASCVSNVDAFEACVLDSISFLRPHLDLSILPIYNRGNIYSASIAANIALDLCKTQFILYVHQDIRFTEKSGMLIAEVIKNHNSEIAIYGAAGIKDYITPDMMGRWGINDLEEGLVGQVYDQFGETIWDGCGGLHYVQSVDEIAMLIDKNSGLKFDPTWPAFHLYGLDYCLQARAAAYKVAACPMELQHCGQYSASIYQDSNFLGRLVDLYGKWGLRFTRLCAPYCQWEDGRIVSYIPFALQDEYHQRLDAPRISVTIDDEYLLTQS